MEKREGSDLGADPSGCWSLANVYPILGVCPRDGYHLSSGTDIAYMDHYWVVECQVCGRAIAIGGQVPATSAMGPHAMLGPHGEPVVDGPRRIGSDRPGIWSIHEPAHALG